MKRRNEPTCTSATERQGGDPVPLPVEGVADVILNSVSDGVFTVDSDWRITSFNRAAEKIIGLPRAEALGRKCCEVFRASICEGSCALRKTLAGGRPVVNRAIFIVNSRGERVPISISTGILRDASGTVIGGVETFRDLSLVEELRRELEHRHSFADIISKNSSMRRIFDILPDVAESGSTVLLEGESGTGKELVARAIHNLSPRCRKPLITVNCGALPDTLLESELFGYKAGAFTDARRDKPGRVALAEGGTLFLDEIGDISQALQVRLLRFLQERTYEPLGATSAEQADVRVVTATNRNLASLMEQGTFRSDLFYRINVVRLVLPPLRERREDIPLLLDHFVSRFNRLRGKDVAGASPQVLEILLNHDFPGNVRELENIVEHAFVLCRGGFILPQHLPEQFRPTSGYLAGPADSLGELRGRFILQALERNGWNRAATARELGMHKTTLWRNMKRLGISPPPGKE